MRQGASQPLNAHHTAWLLLIWSQPPQSSHCFTHSPVRLSPPVHTGVRLPAQVEVHQLVQQLAVYHVAAASARTRGAPLSVTPVVAQLAHWTWPLSSPFYVDALLLLGLVERFFVVVGHVLYQMIQ